MSAHRVRVGQVVQYSPVMFGRQHDRGDFRVQGLVPASGADPQYRITSAADPAERLVLESELSDSRTVQRRAQDLYAAGNAAGVPWQQRTLVIQQAWLTAARAAIAKDLEVVEDDPGG